MTSSWLESRGRSAWIVVGWLLVVSACSSSAPHGTTTGGAAGGGDQGGTGGGGAGGGGAGGGGSGGSAPHADAAIDAQAGGAGGTVEPDVATDATVEPDAADDVTTPGDGPVAGGPFALSSSEFKNGDTIDVMYRCPPNANLSPPLSWTPGPAGTKSYAVTLAHTNTVHWQLWDIPGDVTSLPKDVAKVAMPPVPAGSKQSSTGTNGVMTPGYIGPCPTTPAVSMYQYTVYALKVANLPGVTPASSPAAVTAALKANTLATAMLIVIGHK